MNLPSDLISQFVKITNDNKDTKNETVIYGTIVKQSNTLYVRPDWSDQIIPISKYEVNSEGKIETIVYVNNSAADLREAKDGDRVTIMIKDHVVTVTGNLSSPAASTNDSRLTIGEEVFERVSSIEVDNVKINERLDASEAKVGKVVADNVIIREQLTADEGVINELKAKDVEITGRLEAAEASVETLASETVKTKDLEANYAKIHDLNVTNEKVYNLDATFAEFKDATAERLKTTEGIIENLDTKYASIQRMDVAEGNIEDLESKTGKIDTLIFGEASGNSMQASFANAVIALLGSAWIKSAMIESVNADKITGDIVITEDLEVISEDGHIVIQNGVIQVLDDNKNVRVQLGKDASNNYSITIWDADGNKMFDAGGITANAIKSDIIVNNMVSATADIDASKLNISSLFDVINNDGTKTIKAAKIHLDAEGRSLEAGFNSLTTEVDGLQNEVSSQGSRLAIMEDKITSEVWKQDIDTAKNELGEEINTLSTEHSALEQTVGGMSATVSEHTTTLAGKADNAAVAAVNTKVSELEISLSGFRSTVSETYATKTDLADTQESLDTTHALAESTNDSVVEAQSSIQQLVDSISSLVTDGNGTSLMTQTEEGWTFSTASIQNSVNTVSEMLDTLVNDVGDMDSTVGILQRSVADLGVTAEYIHIGTYDDEPCIELGESDSDFKLIITNTRILFMEGSSAPAYITKQSLHITKAVIEEEIQQGQFVWKVRQNGNMGLMWIESPPSDEPDEPSGDPSYHYDDVDGFYPYDPELWGDYEWSDTCPHCGIVICGHQTYIVSTENCPNCGQEFQINNGTIE